MPSSSSSESLVSTTEWIPSDNRLVLPLIAAAPDFAYYSGGQLASSRSQPLPGLVLFCWPVTLVAAVLFHRLIKEPALRVAPRPVARRLAAFARRPWMPAWNADAIMLLAVSALI